MLDEAQFSQSGDAKTSSSTSDETDLGTRWRQEVQSRIPPIVQHVATIETAAGPEITTRHEEFIHGALQRLMVPDAKVGVAGIYSSGKSTLLNTVCGQALLPEAAKPSSAVPTHLKGGVTRRQVIVRSGTDGRETHDEITEDELQKLRLGDDEATRRLHGARRIECHGVLPPSLEGFTLIDTRGALDADGGAERTVEAAEREDWDALVAVTLQSPGRRDIPSPEMRFFKTLTSGRRPLLIVVNTAFDESLEDEECKALWTAFVQELGRGPAWSRQRLEEGGIHVIHLPRAKQARLRRDIVDTTASGYAAFEEGLMAAIAGRRWPLKLATCLDAVLPRTRLICDSVAAETDGLRADRAQAEEETRQRARVATDREAACAKARKALPPAEETTLKALRDDFSRMMHDTKNHVELLLNERPLATLRHVSDVLSLVKNEHRQALAAEITAIVQEAVQTSVEQWTTGESGMNSVIAQHLDPALKKAQETLKSAHDFLESMEALPAVGSTRARTAAAGMAKAVTGAGTSGLVKSVAFSVAAGAATTAVTYTIAKVLATKIAAILLSGALHGVIMKVVMFKVFVLLVGILQPWVLVAIAATIVTVGVAQALSTVGDKIKKGVVKKYPELIPELDVALWSEIGPVVKTEIEKVTSSATMALRRAEDGLAARREEASAALARDEPVAEREDYVRVLQSIPGEPIEKALASGLPNQTKALLIALDEALDQRSGDSIRALQAHEELHNMRLQAMA